MPFKGWNYYDTISVKFRGQIVATRRDKKPLYPFEPIVEEEDPEAASLPTPEELTATTDTVSPRGAT